MIFGTHLNFFVEANGVQYATLQGETEVGRWRITPEGEYCHMWFVWENQRESCFTVDREGETFALYPKDGLGKHVFRRVSGNPESY
jgi:hypothetical protein